MAETVQSARPRRGRAMALTVALLSGLLFQAPAPAPAQTTPDSAGPCAAGAPADSPQACSGQPLFAQGPAPTAFYTSGLLPSGQVGRAYPKIRVVRGGIAPFNLVKEIDVPPGLYVTTDGYLTGSPTRPGRYSMRLIVRDSGRPTGIVQGDYGLRILDQPAPKAAPKPPPPPPAAATPGEVVVYTLTQADLKVIDKKVADLAAAQAAEQATKAADAKTARQSAEQAAKFASAFKPLLMTQPAPPAPPAAQGGPPAAAPTTTPSATTASSGAPTPMSTRLAPMVNREYPSLNLFEASLRLRLGDENTFRALSPDIAMIARKVEPMWAAPTLRVDDLWNCDCVRPHSVTHPTNIYAFLPFWRPTSPGQKVDFSQFNRIELMGVQLKDDGTWLRPAVGDGSGVGKWWDDTARVAAAAQGHGAQVDLVLERSDWSFLRGLDDAALAELDKRAADNAAMLADLPEPPAVTSFFRGLLWGFWRKPDHTFSGLTVMFHPPADPGDRRNFKVFVTGFVDELITNAKAKHRDFALNLVIFDDLAAAQPRPTIPAAREPDDFAGGRLFTWRELTTWRNLLAGPGAKASLADAAAQAGSSFASPGGKPLPLDATRSGLGAAPKLEMKFLVFLPEETRVEKKLLRSDIDFQGDPSRPSELQGDERVAMLHSVIPILSEAAGEAPKPNATPGKSTFADQGRIHDDLAYFNENFGGVGFWPTPIPGVDSGAVVGTQLAEKFFARDPTVLGLTLRHVCSTAIRLLWQATILFIPLAVLVYFFADFSPAHRRIFVYVIAGVAAVSFTLGFYLLEFDTDLDAVKQGNAILLTTVAILGLTALGLAVRPRVKDP